MNTGIFSTSTGADFFHQQYPTHRGCQLDWLNPTYYWTTTFEREGSVFLVPGNKTIGLQDLWYIPSLKLKTNSARSWKVPVISFWDGLFFRGYCMLVLGSEKSNNLHRLSQAPRKDWNWLEGTCFFLILWCIMFPMDRTTHVRWWARGV